MRFRLAALTALAAATLAAPAAEAAVTVIPKPASFKRSGERFDLARDTRIVAGRGDWACQRARRAVAPLDRLPAAGDPKRRPAIYLELGDTKRLGREGYRLRVSRRAVRLRAVTAAGLFNSAQTLRQLLPAKVESATSQPGPWRVPGVRIGDRPRFPWRGAHLDVSRHFFSVAEVKRYIDLISQYRSTSSTCT